MPEPPSVAGWGRRVGALVVGGVALSGCSGDGQSEPVWPPAPHAVDVVLDDYRFSYDWRIPAGRVVFRVRNAGTVDHELQFLPLAEEIPPIDEQLRGTERRVVSFLAGTPHRRPGQTGTYAVDLAPGRRYALVCFLRDADGTQHTLKGMSSEFRTTQS